VQPGCVLLGGAVAGYTPEADTLSTYNACVSESELVYVPPLGYIAARGSVLEGR
jgi:hypothetical protein